MGRQRSRRRRVARFARDAGSIAIVIVGLSLLPGSRFGEHGDWNDAQHWIGRAAQWFIGLVLIAVVALAHFPEIARRGRRSPRAVEELRDDD